MSKRSDPPAADEPVHIAPEIYELYDEYCHSQMERRDFLRRAAGATAGGMVMALALLPRYAAAQTISFTDPRIHARYVTYKSPGGNGGEMRGYLVKPAGEGREGRFPGVLIVHENRGLNPYIEDVARRAAVEGFLAFAPDALTPLGGYPGNDEDGKALQAKLDRDKIHVDMLNGARFLKSHPLSTGKLGVTGFCFGGGVSNYLATEMGSELQAAAPFYGQAAPKERVPRIKASLVIHWAEDDPRINAMRPEYEAALKANGVDWVSYSYPGTKHGFHNNSTPRYDEKAAKLAWSRTIDLFKRKLV